MVNNLINNPVMVTGSNGFLGKYLCNYLENKNFRVVRASRNYLDNKKINLDFENKINWSEHLVNIKCIIHTAAKVHLLKKRPTSKKHYDKINYEGTISLAEQAALCGVSRFIYISSAKVCGEKTDLDKPVNENCISDLTDPYAISKLYTEKKLIQISKKTKMEIVIIRPPLVYGPGVKANFLSMMKWLNMGIPLPFAEINNLRSLISLENLSDFICLCIDNLNAKNETFLISDDQDISTSRLLEKITLNLNKRVNLFSINKNIIYFSFLIIGQINTYERLFNSLHLDITKAKSLIGWNPKKTLDEGLYETTKYFLRN